MSAAVRDPLVNDRECREPANKNVSNDFGCCFLGGNEPYLAANIVLHNQYVGITVFSFRHVAEVKMEELDRLGSM